MLKLDTKQSTIADYNKIWSANQPIRLVFTDDEEPEYLSVVLDGQTFTAYNINDQYIFDLTSYVRNQFSYEETPSTITQIGSYTIASDSALIQKVDMPIASKNSDDTLQTQQVVFVNCVVERDGKLDEYAPIGVFTSFDKINIYDYPNWLYMTNPGGLYWFYGDYNNIAKVDIKTSTKEKVIGFNVNNIGNASGSTLYCGAYICETPSLGDTFVYDEMEGRDDGRVEWENFYFKFANSQIYNVYPTFEKATPAVLTYTGSFDPDDSDTWGRLIEVKDYSSFNLNDNEDGFVVIWYPRELVEERLEAGEFTYPDNCNVFVGNLDAETHSGDSVQTNNFTIDVTRKTLPHERYSVRWINEYGGWDYYTFDHKQSIQRSISDVTTLNIGRKKLIDSAYITTAKTRTKSVAVKSNTELQPVFEALAFLPFSTKIQKWIPEKSTWMDIAIEDYDTSWFVCQKAGSLEFTFIENAQYGLSWV